MANRRQGWCHCGRSFIARTSSRQWRAHLCRPHWLKRLAESRRASGARIAARNRAMKGQRAARDKQWTIKRPYRAGRWTEPRKIFVCKANHWGNSLCHIKQSRAGTVKEAKLLTIATCELALRYRVAKFCKNAGFDFDDLGARGIYIVVAGAATPNKNSGLSSGHNWAREVAGRPLCVLRVSQLVPPAEAARRNPNRADVNRILATGEVSATTRHDRFAASAKRRTRSGAPVVYSMAFRRFLAPPGTDKMPASIWEPLKAFSYPDASEYGPEDDAWSDAVAVVRATWEGWQPAE